MRYGTIRIYNKGTWPNQSNKRDFLREMKIGVKAKGWAAAEQME